MAIPPFIFSPIFLVFVFVISFHGHQLLAKNEAQFGGNKSLFPHKTRVRVYNNLGENLTLALHCKSKNTDFGVHLLKNGEYFAWKFRPNIFGTTLYWCYMGWKKENGAFDIYVASRDSDRCRRCVWKVTEDGVRGYDKEEGGDEQIWFRWVPKPPGTSSMLAQGLFFETLPT